MPLNLGRERPLYATLVKRASANDDVTRNVGYKMGKLFLFIVFPDMLKPVIHHSQQRDPEAAGSEQVCQALINNI